MQRHGAAMTLAMLSASPSGASALWAVAPLRAATVEAAKVWITDDKVPLAQSGARVLGAALASGDDGTLADHSATVGDALARALADRPSDVRRTVAGVIKAVAKAQPAVALSHAPAWVTGLLVCVREKNIPLKLAAERALLHLLRLADGEETLAAVTARVDAATGKALGDYHRRVLSKLGTAEGDSDGESELADQFEAAEGAAAAAAN